MSSPSNCLQSSLVTNTWPKGVPFTYIEYDSHDDMVNVGVGGRDGRYPVVLRHTIEPPTRRRRYFRSGGGVDGGRDGR